MGRSDSKADPSQLGSVCSVYFVDPLFAKKGLTWYTEKKDAIDSRLNLGVESLDSGTALAAYRSRKDVTIEILGSAVVIRNVMVFFLRGVLT